MFSHKRKTGLGTIVMLMGPVCKSKYKNNTKEREYRDLAHSSVAEIMHSLSP
jgi:hypothetical protein